MFVVPSVIEGRAAVWARSAIVRLRKGEGRFDLAPAFGDGPFLRLDPVACVAILADK